MDYAIAGFSIALVSFWFGYFVGVWATEYPSISEMTRRVKKAKFEEALRKAVDEKIDRDLES